MTAATTCPPPAGFLDAYRRADEHAAACTPCETVPCPTGLGLYGEVKTWREMTTGPTEEVER